MIFEGGWVQKPHFDLDWGGRGRVLCDLRREEGEAQEWIWEGGDSDPTWKTPVDFPGLPLLLFPLAVLLFP